jgi:riboflavin transporter FmnP
MQQSNKLKAVLFAGILAALGFVLMRFTEFPLISSAPFLKTDLGDLPILLGTIFLGPWYGVGMALVKDLLYLLSGGGGGGLLGAFINFIAVGVFAFVLGAFTQRKKGYLSVFLGLIAGTITMTIAMFFVNMWAVPTFWFPGITHKKLMVYLYATNIPFNLLKGSLDTVFTLPLFIALKKRKKM